MLTQEEKYFVVEQVNGGSLNSDLASKYKSVWAFLTKNSYSGDEDALALEKLRVYRQTKGRIDHFSDFSNFDPKKLEETLALLLSPEFEEIVSQLSWDRGRKLFAAFQAEKKTQNVNSSITANQFHERLKQKEEEWRKSKSSLEVRGKPGDHRPSDKTECHICNGRGSFQNRTCTTCRGFGYLR